ncbi:uncharacterized protein LOC105779050 [Gossypium raimondii]|uniref:uncharacterized protein LOC105779050 n=1 Tax=Gossypium raimondii TaxID=29730 RepID=UPI00063AC365|nr:uncharacterized protein LOC105779050 [Gossypium raimondii]
MMNSFIAEKTKTARLCGICTTPDHAIDACPSLYDDTMAHLDTVRNFPGPPQRRYNPYANIYNPGWKDHPNLSYGANLRNNQPYQNRFLQQPQGSGNFLETMVNKLAANVLDFQQQNLNFQKETKDFQQKIEASIRELTTSIEKLTSQGKLPSQTEPKLRQNANAVTLRSRKILETIPDRNLGQEIAQKKPEKDEQQIPQYAKFLKELCTNKRKLTGNERLNVGENVSAVLHGKISAKCKDMGMFAIPCRIGHLGIKKAMCDLGASINVTLYSIYKSLNASFLTKTDVIIQLADRSVVHLEGVLEDFLFDGEIVKFNVYDAISHPSEILSLNRIGIIDFLMEDNFELIYRDNSELDEFEFVNELLSPNTKLLPSAIQAPELELEPAGKIKQSGNAKKTVEQCLEHIEARLETFGR